MEDVSRRVEEDASKEKYMLQFPEILGAYDMRVRSYVVDVNKLPQGIELTSKGALVLHKDAIVGLLHIVVKEHDGVYTSEVVRPISPGKSQGSSNVVAIIPLKLDERRVKRVVNKGVRKLIPLSASFTEEKSGTSSAVRNPWKLEVSYGTNGNVSIGFPKEFQDCKLITLAYQNSYECQKVGDWSYASVGGYFLFAKEIIGNGPQFLYRVEFAGKEMPKEGKWISVSTTMPEKHENLVGLYGKVSES